MIIKSKEAASIKYTITLKDRALLDIMNRDRDTFGEERELWEIIEKIDGVQNIDYDGHLGNYIYIEVDTEHDIKTTWKLIYDSINSYV